MPEQANRNLESCALENDSESAIASFQPPKIETLSIPSSHEERLEWVRKSCERFFEKIREMDARLGIPELN